MPTIDYEYKARILNTSLCKEINTIDRRRYMTEAFGIIEDTNFDYDFEEMMLLASGYSSKDIKEARKINHARYKRTERLERRIMSYLLQGKCLFVTLTFNDDVLSSTSMETRRRYVARFLKSQSSLYVANIDFGKTTKREHYHAVIVKDRIEANSWPYGFDSYKKIRCDKLGPLKLAKYISKLTNHAIKETTKRCCYIYSRSTC